ncbi:MAG: hypothetical protein K2L00_10485 [Muribaculaceae bacterium]|nr:hypothetical protein [Muribaculaceae bacterium]
MSQPSGSMLLAGAPDVSGNVAPEPSLRMNGDARGGWETALPLSDDASGKHVFLAVDLRDSMPQET